MYRLGQQEKMRLAVTVVSFLILFGNSATAQSNSDNRRQISKIFISLDFNKDYLLREKHPITISLRGLDKKLIPYIERAGLSIVSKENEADGVLKLTFRSASSSGSFADGVHSILIAAEIYSGTDIKMKVWKKFDQYKFEFEPDIHVTQYLKRLSDALESSVKKGKLSVPK